MCVCVCGGGGGVLGVIGGGCGVGWCVGVVRRSVCLVVGPVAVGGCGLLFICTTVGQASDLVTALA